MEQQNNSNSVPEALIPLREKIDAIDHQILGLLEQRNTVVEEVAAVKKTTGFGIRDYTQERRFYSPTGVSEGHKLVYGAK